MLIKKFIAIYTSLAIFASPISFADTTNDIKTNTDALKVDVTSLSQDMKRLEKLLQLVIAQQAAEGRAKAYEGEEGQTKAQQKVDESQEKIQKAVDKLGSTQLDNGVGSKLRENMQKCAKKIQEKSANLPGTTGNEKNGCTTDEIGAMLADLETKRKKSLETWNTCRKILLEQDADPKTIPADPTGIDRKQAKDSKLKPTLKNISDKFKGVAQCGDGLDEIYQEITNQEDAGAAMAMILNTAAQACMASGANPYVCGAIFLIAILTSLFGSGSGDGDGDGKSDGTGEDGNGKPGGGVNVSAKPAPNPAPGNIDGADVQELIQSKSGNTKCKKTDNNLVCKRKDEDAYTFRNFYSKVKIEKGNNISDANFKTIQTSLNSNGGIIPSAMKNKASIGNLGNHSGIFYCTDKIGKVGFANNKPHKILFYQEEGKDLYKVDIILSEEKCSAE